MLDLVTRFGSRPVASLTLDSSFEGWSKSLATLTGALLCLDTHSGRRHSRKKASLELSCVNEEIKSLSLEWRRRWCCLVWLEQVTVAAAALVPPLARVTSPASLVARISSSRRAGKKSHYWLASGTYEGSIVSVLKVSLLCLKLGPLGRPN